jgi:hypothetical protein
MENDLENLPGVPNLTEDSLAMLAYSLESGI